MTTQPTSRDGARPGTCEFCGRELPVRTFKIPGHLPITAEMPCDCEEARAKAKAEEDERLREERNERFRTAWARSGVPEEYLRVTSDGSQFDTLSSGRSVYIFGPNGRGKTHLSCQMAKHYLVRSIYREDGWWHQKSLMFVEVQDVFTSLKSSWDRWDQTEEDVKSRYVGVDLLVLDDFGKGCPTEWAASQLESIINTRYANGRPMIITSQYSPQDLSKRYSGAGAGTISAIQSRLLGWCEGIRLDGPDRRLVVSDGR